MSSGKLYYLIGRSGSGKDAILERLRHYPGVVVAHRYITRAADAGSENHIALTAAEFSRREQAGALLFAWQAHQLHYGVGIEVRHWLAAGLQVFVNGSRDYLPEARARLGAQLIPVLVSVTDDTARQRLHQRQRETPAEIAQRMQRQIEVPIEDALVIDNNGPLDASLAQLARQLPALGLVAEGVQ